MNTTTEPRQQAIEVTYVHRFTTSVTARAHVILEPFCMSVEWDPKPSPKKFRKMLPEYVAWRDTIIQDIYRRTGKRALILDLI